MMPEPAIYRHTQTGVLIWIISCLTIAILLIALLLSLSQLKSAGAIYPSDQTILLRLLGAMFVMGMTLALFFRLTVTVDDHYVRAVFGIGIIGKRVPLKAVAAVRPVTNPWWYGLGIHMIPGGWIWNLSGTKAIELKLKNGRLYRFGTDEPEVLTEIVRGKIFQI